MENYQALTIVYMYLSPSDDDDDGVSLIILELSAAPGPEVDDVASGVSSFLSI